jgi:hypothetical protein
LLKAFVFFIYNKREMLSCPEVILGERIILHEHGETFKAKSSSSKIVQTVYSSNTEVLHSTYDTFICYQQPENKNGNGRKKIQYDKSKDVST